MKLARIFAACITAAGCFGPFTSSFGAEPAASERGACSLDANRISGTYGFSAQGNAIGGNPFVPVGRFSQAGTATLKAETDTGSTLTGTGSVTLAQNDSKGYTPNVSFSGTFQLDKTTCSGDFYVTSPMQIDGPAFRLVFVDGGEEVRVIAAIPNLIVSYSTAKKL